MPLKINYAKTRKSAVDVSDSDLFDGRMGD